MNRIEKEKTLAFDRLIKYNLWRMTFKLNEFLDQSIKEDMIQDVASGGEYTIVLTRNNCHVIS